MGLLLEFLILILKKRFSQIFLRALRGSGVFQSLFQIRNDITCILDAH